jgi:hypothetical protein
MSGFILLPFLILASSRESSFSVKFGMLCIDERFSSVLAALLVTPLFVKNRGK